MLIDTHAHLQMKDYNSDRQAVIKRAKAEGIEYIINASFDIPSSQLAVKLADENEGLFASVGIHPHDAKTLDERALEILRELAKNKKVVAIGEIGLDYYRDLSPRTVQRSAFIAQMNLARELNLPIIIHNRDSFEDMITILKENFDGLSGVMHCFSGDQDFADKCLELGLYISFAGPVTYPNSVVLQKIATNIPKNKFFVETDCPYLSPQFMRGKRNEPSYIKAVAKKLAELRHDTLPNISKYTSENAIALFKLNRENK